MTPVLTLFLTAALTAPVRVEPGGRLDRVPCGAEGRYSYALYAPKSYDPARRWPVLYVFDPRARGPFGADLFKALADRHGYLVASSNDTRSDTQDARPSLEAIQAMWEDTHERLPLAPGRALAAGFSGGARLATILGAWAGGELFGVLLAGAGFAAPDKVTADTPFVVAAAVGRFDFNYYELRTLERRLRELGLAHAVEYFDGPHAWPPAETLEQGFEWLELQAMRRGRRERDETWLDAWERSALARAAALEADGRALEAADAYRGVAQALSGLRDSRARAEAERLEARPDVPRERRRRERLDHSEEVWILERYALLNRLIPGGRRDPPPLPELLRELEVERLRREARASEDLYRREAWTRRIESLFVQASFYLPRRLREAGEPGRAAVSLQVAVALKPESAFARYDLACALAQAGRRKEALAELRRAVEAGFGNRAYLAQDEDLAPLRSLPGFLELSTPPAPAEAPPAPRR